MLKITNSNSNTIYFNEMSKGKYYCNRVQLIKMSFVIIKFNRDFNYYYLTLTLQNK